MTEQGLLDFLDNETIDWSRIGRAVEFYKALGYQYIEVPWVAPSAIIRETLPPGGKPYKLVGEPLLDIELVGSAEQSLLWMAKRGSLRGFTAQRFVGVSPCFRGDERSTVRQKTFMKVELWAPPFTEVSADAWEFFKEEGAVVNRVTTPNGKDLYVAGLEVGSYGHRTSGEISWTYGTGLAEPRFSQALAEQDRARRANR